MNQRKDLTKLSPREWRFIDEYLVDLNPSQAVIRAGFRVTKGSSYVMGSTLLSNPTIQCEIKKRQLILQERTTVTAERVINELAKIAFSNIGGLFDVKTGTMKTIDKMDPNDLAAVSSINIDENGGSGYRPKHLPPVTTKKVKMYDKVRALEKLGQHLGLFKDAQETQESMANAIKELARKLPD